MCSWLEDSIGGIRKSHNVCLSLIGNINFHHSAKVLPNFFSV